jgi:hypothetical protein
VQERPHGERAAARAEERAGERARRHVERGDQLSPIQEQS